MQMARLQNPRMLSRRALIAAAISMGAFMALPMREAEAHPHVFVTASTTVNIEQGAITGFDHVWTFDEFYTAMAVQDLDKNKDGKIDREELKELAKLNMDGLKEFKYFTFPTLGGQELAVVDPKDGQYWAEHKNGILSMHFKLLLEKPVLMEAKDFEFGIYDPSMYIGFELDKVSPVKLNAGAPKTCTASVEDPKPESDASKKLGDAFFGQLGGTGSSLSFAKTIKVLCK